MFISNLYKAIIVLYRCGWNTFILVEKKALCFYSPPLPPPPFYAFLLFYFLFPVLLHGISFGKHLKHSTHIILIEAF